MMSKIGGVLLVVLLLGCATSPDPVPDYKQAEDSVVILIHKYGMTSGVVISEDGYVLSCAHAGPPMEAYAKQFFDDMETALITKCEKIEVVYFDKDLDIGIYKITDPRYFAVAKISEREVEKGEDLFSVGTPLGAPYYISWGKMIKYLYRPRIGTPYILHSCCGNMGNSGGPLFNMDGELVGINVLMYAAIPTMSGYVALIDGLLAIRVRDFFPAIEGIIQTHRNLQVSLNELKAAQRHIDEIERERPD